MEEGLLRLAAATLECAISDWRVGAGRPELFDDARRATFTFKDVCNVLGAEPDWLRAMIREEYGESKE